MNSDADSEFGPSPLGPLGEGSGGDLTSSDRSDRPGGLVRTTTIRGRPSPGMPPELSQPRRASHTYTVGGYQGGAALPPHEGTGARAALSLRSVGAGENASGPSGTRRHPARPLHQGGGFQATAGRGPNLGGLPPESETAGAAAPPPQPPPGVPTTRTYRRYGVGERVLVCNHQSRWANLVNRYGYPDGGGHTPEEQRGPYVYVLATVKQVHFEEDAQYYTVTRADTGAEQRADAEWMEPLRSARGEAAALRAATESASAPLGNAENKKRKAATSQAMCLRIVKYIFLPFVLLYRLIYFLLIKRLRSGWKVMRRKLKAQATLALNGIRPYSCSMRVTGINLLVLCSTWYMFIDQMRLAFFPPGADFAVSVTSSVIWFIMLLELFFETFIRPRGYYALLQTDKAFAPATVRNINNFHLVVETLSLALFVPEILCVFTSYQCGDRRPFSLLNASIMGVLGPTRLDAFYGRAFYALVRLRIFGLVRHWKQMWINNTFVNLRWKNKQSTFITSVLMPPKGNVTKKDMVKFTTDVKTRTTDIVSGEPHSEAGLKQSAHNDEHLTNASTIGTALMVVNSHRAFMIICAIVGVLPIISTLAQNGGTNTVSTSMVRQLQGTNLISNTVNNETCSFLEQSIESWMVGVWGGTPRVDEGDVYVLWLQVLPVRCEFQEPDGVVTASYCDSMDMESSGNDDDDTFCEVWRDTDATTSIDELAEKAGVRTGVVTVSNEFETWPIIFPENGTTSETVFNVTAIFNQNFTVQPSNSASFVLQVALLVSVLGGLSVLRVDAGRLVLGPLRRMLKIVALYAKNPLSPAKVRRKGKKNVVTTNIDDDDSADDHDSDSDSEDDGDAEDQLGNYETEQLINAIAKITDLLRKCWGVAGAGIISSNLARQEDGQTAVFNPCVPGKSVYALFGFVAINGFDHQLRALGGEIMILINDVANVLHSEVFRWGFGNSGQCNKNLGSAFLMVFRIGDVKEVKEKRERATNVIFSSDAIEKRRTKRTAAGERRRHHYATLGSGMSEAGSMGSGAVTFHSGVRIKKKVNTNTRAMSLSLSSLPGINAFTDRALIGMLKSFAGIYRDHKLLNWKNDFRLGAGVGAFSVDMIFGMDAGWAVEGAVGSEYKIDATYLSPHVNMASRMMSACKQYGVVILLSQAVEELLSDTARTKLRHLDTVTVKGSSVKQRIFTYDARHKGVDFFLFGRSNEQADLDAERYSTNLWNTDQDLTAMRQHVTEEFMEEFNQGRREYLAGNWPSALKHLKAADDIMVDTVMDQGYIDDELNEIQARIMDGEDAKAEEAIVRNEMGDGPSRCLIAFMEKEGGVAPASWQGFRPLTSK